MYYELYIDVFFLVNFMMDYLLLRLTGKMMKCSATHGRIIAGAAAGSLCTCAVMVIPGMNTCVPHPISTCLEQYAVIYGAKELWINDCHLVWTIRTPCGMYGT